MREEALVVIYGKKKRACSSCKGEIGEHPGNKVRRDFHVDGPNKLWLTDVTQFALTSCECSLSAIIDCLDGKVASHRLSRTPDADLASSTLAQAAGSIQASEHLGCQGDGSLDIRISPF